MKSSQILKKQLATKEKEVEALRKKIEQNEKANPPKNIMDLINSFEDACKYKKVKPRSIYRIDDTPDEIAYKKLKFTIKVLNEGHVFTMKPNEERHYPYFNISSGFVFSAANYGGAYAHSGSASRLCLKSFDLAVHAGKILLSEWKAFIM